MFNITELQIHSNGRTSVVRAAHDDRIQVQQGINVVFLDSTTVEQLVHAYRTLYPKKDIIEHETPHPSHDLDIVSDNPNYEYVCLKCGEVDDIKTGLWNQLSKPCRIVTDV